MENFLTLMNSIMELWMSPSTMDMAMDMTIAIMSGAGLFFLLTPFLKEYPVPPPSESKRDIPKDVQRGQSNTRKKAAPVKGWRDGGNDVEEIKTPSQSMKIPNKQLFLGSTPQPFWEPSQKMDHLPLSQLLSYLKVLEHLIQRKFSQLFWGIRSVFSESVVSTAQIFRSHISVNHKYVPCCGPAQALSKTQGLPQFSQDQPLSHKIVVPSLVGVTGIQELENLPNSTTKQIPHCLQSTACLIACPATERGTQISVPTENHSWLHGQYCKDNISYDIQKHQKAISKPTGNLPADALHNKAIRTSFILPKHCQMLQHFKKPENEDKANNVKEQQGTPFRFVPSRELTQLQGHFPPKSDHCCKSRPQLSQPAQPSILNSQNYKCSKMVGSVPTGLPLKALANSDVHNTIKKGFGVGAKKVPCALSSSPGEMLKPRSPALRTDNRSNMNPAEPHSFLDSKTEMELASNITELLVKRRRRPYLQILEAKDLTPPGVPAPNLPQIVYPSAPICDSKAEYCSKAAIILENLHHRDPGGTRLESVSAAKVESAEFIHSPTEVQETQRAPPPAASHGASKAHPDPLERYLCVQQPSFCFQKKTQQSRTIRGTGKDSQQSNATPKMATHAPLRRFQDVSPKYSHCRATVVGLEEKVPPSAAKQSNALGVKEELPCASRVSLGSSEIHNGQATDINPRVCGSLEANRSPAHLQTPTPGHSWDSTRKSQLCGTIDLISKKQPQAWPVRHHPYGPSTVHPAKVSLPSQHTLPHFQNRCQHTKTSQGLCDVFRKRHERVETDEISAPKAKIEVMDLKGFHPPEERQSSIRSTGVSQGERVGSIRPSIPSSTQLKDTVKTQIPEKEEATSQSSLKNLTRNVFQYRNLQTKCKGEQDSLKNSRPPPATEQTQKAVTRKKLMYHRLDELQSLMNVLVQIVDNPEGDPSKLLGCKVESLTSQLGASSHSSEGLYDTNHSRAASRRSCGYASLKEHNHPSTYGGSGDKLQSGVEAQRACEQHPKQVKRGMGSDLSPAPKENVNLCRYRATEVEHKPCLAVQRAYNPGKIRIKIGLGHCPHRSPEGHHHSLSYTETGDKEQPGIAHKVFDPHQRTKKGMGGSCLISTKENHPGDGELEASSTQVLLPGEPLTPSRPYQNRSRSWGLRSSLPSHTSFLEDVPSAQPCFPHASW